MTRYPLLHAAVLLAAAQCLAPSAAAAPAGTPLGTRTVTTLKSQPDTVPLRAQQTFRLHGGHVAAGTDMRNKGYGTIEIVGIPAGARIVSASLFWGVLDLERTKAQARGVFNGVPIQGTFYAKAADPCWGSNAAYGYQADVTALVAGNGRYALSDFASGLTDGSSPWVGYQMPLAEGATLAIVYEHPDAPFVETSVLVGGRMVLGPYKIHLSGFKASNPVTFASFTSFGADGQSNAPGEEIYFNGSLLSMRDWDGADGPNELWDTHTHDVTAWIQPGSTQAKLTYSGNTNDCLVPMGGILTVSADPDPR